jgi:hypothetical protein
MSKFFEDCEDETETTLRLSKTWSGLFACWPNVCRYLLWRTNLARRGREGSDGSFQRDRRGHREQNATVFNWMKLTCSLCR